MRYWYDIDLNSIAMGHTLVRDPKTGYVYVFMYNENGIAQQAVDKAFNKYEQSTILARMEG